MKSRLAQALVLAVGVGLMSGSALAHHGDAGRYNDYLTTVTGTVVQLMFINPHSVLVWDVKDEKGQVVRWLGEWGAPRGLAQGGITRDTLRVGDTITVSARQRKGGETYMTLSECARVLDATGKELWRGNNPATPPGFTGDPCGGSIPIR